jgi:hypothetical protein
MNPKIYSNIKNYLIIYTLKVIPWGQMDKQTNKQANKRMDRQTNGRTDGQTDGQMDKYLLNILRDKLALSQGSLGIAK